MAGNIQHNARLSSRLRPEPARRLGGPLRPAPLLAGSPCAPCPSARTADPRTANRESFYCGVITTKQILLLLDPAALLIVSRPSVTVTVDVPSIQRVALVGVP